jgi:signal transduction histidine kinase
MTMGAWPEVGRPAVGQLTPTAVRELLDKQSAFIRLTVHELRRPLALAQGHLSMISDGTFGSIPEQADPSLQATASAVQEMGALVDGLAAVARLDDGAAPLRRQRCSLGRLAAGCMASVETEARDRHVALQQHGPDVDADVDPAHLRIALLNLLSNAIQHSPAGSTVALSVAVADEAVTITVADRGPGIAAGEADHVFEPWYQGQQASDGLGLGLWIVHRIVEWHGGRLTLESAPERGSTFGIVLPRRGAGRVGGPGEW